MEILNATRMLAGYTMGMKPDGRELLVVVVKGTFDIPDDAGQTPQLSPKQIPLVMADEFTGEPGFSATTVEADFVPFKPRAEFLLNGTAYAPRGRPETEVEVGVRVGSLVKRFRVIGNRVWTRGARGPIPSQPEPFLQMPITYDVAFGGTDETEEPHTAYRFNPVGRGYHHRPYKDSVWDRPLPNTEELGYSVNDPRGDYRPMSYGPCGRVCPPRVQYAGTYDEGWFQDQFPFLPHDFDERYYQSAPADQQLDELHGNTPVELLNLTPGGLCRFRLPEIRVPIEFICRDYESVEREARLDTFIMEPDEGRFTLVWRTALPLKRNMFEVNMAIVGKMPRAWYRARSLSKTYYPDLNELILAKNE